jgi:hypothetical protein
MPKLTLITALVAVFMMFVSAANVTRYWLTWAAAH